MRRSKISIIGAGNVGATTAHWCAAAELGDIVLVDIPAAGDMPKGKALDLMESSPIMDFDANVVGTSGYDETVGSDVVVVTAGIPRKPGMSRDDLLSTNAKIVSSVAQEIKQSSPDATIIVVSNPLDAMVQRTWQVTGFPHQRVLGQAGVLDTARYRAFLAMELGVSVEDVSALLMGGHGDTMVPMPSCTSVGGIPITRLLGKARLEEIVDRTRKGGAEIVGLLKTGSAYYAPAAACAQMAEAVIRDKKRLIPCAAYCDKEYGVGGYYVGVPVVLGTGGVERVVELELEEQERADFAKSVDAVKELVAKMNELMGVSIASLVSDWRQAVEWLAWNASVAGSREKLRGKSCLHASCRVSWRRCDSNCHGSLGSSVCGNGCQGTHLCIVYNKNGTGMNRNQLCLGQDIKQITNDLNIEHAVFRSAKHRDTVYSMFVPQHYEPNYAYPLLIWLHGTGDDICQLRRVMPLISMRNYAGIAPQGTCRLDDDSTTGYMWTQTVDSIMRAQRAVMDCMTAAGQRFHLADRRVFLAGFGTGGTMAMRVGFSRPDLFAGVVSLGGSFPAGHNPLQHLCTARDMPLLIAHGRDGVRYSEDDVCDDLRLLHTAGVSITLRQYPCRDELAPQMLSDVDTWMMEIVTGTSCPSSSNASPASDSLN